MKTILFTAALALSGAAVAQTANTQTSTQMQTDTTTIQATTQSSTTMQTGTGTPERDARGIPVVSMPADAPSGANQAVTIPAGAQVTVNPNQAQVFQSRQSTEEFPPCTRERTDRCVQNYERGNR